MSVFSVALVLFLILDPVGTVSYYLNLMKDVDPKRRNRVLVREMLIVLAVMIGFNCLGEYIFRVLELSETTVRLSSGVILFLVAIKILFPTTDSIRANLPKGEPFVVPLAIPLLAGPSLMATLMLYAHLEPYQSVMWLAILYSWVAAFIILYFAEPIKKVLGDNGLMACERLMGMVLVLVAVQRFLEGILLFWATQPNPV